MNKALDCALRLLARREHGAEELFQKLKSKGFSAQSSREVVDECKRLGYQCDTRYTEFLVRVRTQQGYGPIRITQELQAKRIESDIIASSLQVFEEAWGALALSLLNKKSTIENSKQQRYLLNRGFPMAVVKAVTNLKN